MKRSFLQMRIHLLLKTTVHSGNLFASKIIERLQNLPKIFIGVQLVIAERWRLHFNQIYNSNVDIVSKSDVYNKLFV